MLRYKEKVDIDARFTEVEAAVDRWRERIKTVSDDLRNELAGRLQISLIYHDAALEGDVLTHSEIKAAIDPTIISDTSLIPSYEAIKNYNDASIFASSVANNRKKPVKLETLREIYAILAPEQKSHGLPYRKENPLHRLYYHEICPPEKISYRVRKLSEWMDNADIKNLHPLERVAQTHHKIMHVFPWAKQSGRCARIISNLLLEKSNYPMAIIHSIDRQRYYESLRNDHTGLLTVYLEAVETTAVSAVRVYDEAERAPRRRRRA